ncbi:hypothetical protein GZ78_12215 [Endozoicomonas numazuensis]|uniref:Uncharacterized protein n=1 Tax=Endozoicomonas numazuensis TaxID=1137799 RepID=A0A081NIK8_9GAMM|nr:hypothetical protein GZ78_12215 [Endozoicomonas numazuensis]
MEFFDCDINPEISLDEQLDSLKEDMCQVRYGNNLILDFGWYPSFSAPGCFQIRVIKNYNWEDPILTKEARNLVSLKQMIIDAVKLICKLNE